MTLHAILRPIGQGDLTEIYRVYYNGVEYHPSTNHPEYHCLAVDEGTPNEDTDYVAKRTISGGSYESDLYRLTSVALGGSIESVTVYNRTRVDNAAISSQSYSILKTGGVVHSGASSGQHAATYNNYSYTWYTNPTTGLPWIWSDIASLQAGVKIWNSYSSDNHYSLCTQVWGDVAYNPTRCASAQLIGPLW